MASHSSPMATESENGCGKCEVRQQRDDICYHHYSLVFNSEEIPIRFQEIRFVLVAGCSRRAEMQAKYLVENTFNGRTLQVERLETLTKATSRFTLFRVGPVLISNHGMGSASMSIALHELFLMCQEANVMDRITVIRFGTCGGIGVDKGTLCITNKAYDPLLNDFIELKICSQLVRRDCVIDLKTVNLLKNLAIAEEEKRAKELGRFLVTCGATIGTNDFYEEQGRTNGAICDHSQEDKMRFLMRCKEVGVINMEMESNYMAAMCHKLQVDFAVVCVALNNRLEEDKVRVSSDEMVQFERRLFWINSLFIKHKQSLVFH